MSVCTITAFGFGGQSAPPSLKGLVKTMPATFLPFRGAVRPPFIEGMPLPTCSASLASFGGQSAPPSLKLGFRCWGRVEVIVSGGSPPPLH